MVQADCPSCCSRCRARKASASSTRSCPRSARTGVRAASLTGLVLPGPDGAWRGRRCPGPGVVPRWGVRQSVEEWMMSWGCTSPHRRASASSTRSCPRSAPRWRWAAADCPSCCSRCRAARRLRRRPVRVHVVPALALVQLARPGLPGPSLASGRRPVRVHVSRTGVHGGLPRLVLSARGTWGLAGGSVHIHVVPNARVHASGLPVWFCHVPGSMVLVIDPFVST